MGSSSIESSTVTGSTTSEGVVAPQVGPDMVETSRETKLNNTNEISDEFTTSAPTTSSSDPVLREEAVATPIALNSDDKGKGKRQADSVSFHKATRIFHQHYTES